MISVVKLIIIVILSVTLELNESIAITEENEYFASVMTRTKDFKKARAFVILTNKCNVCHHKRNRRRVFTEKNMNGWANDVYKEVFIKKRMPKGKKIKLTSKEYQDLLTWISSTKSNQNGNKL
ncbi:hypothetical protein [Psychroserpens sp. SPM9]|uniref:hypothetical protein n=1 Tax=Psychroserpens sp. SPM9 TaxID=2975598 RepID=UPI0021A71AA2|nr:hypothetical protein [Psychroserpens sp. SPM9]MDG5491309.1 hypothetical protein [Psychroserpens sp. SPM9]